MGRGEPGTTCVLRASVWRGPPPLDGDFLRTAAGSCYRIDAARQTRSGAWRLDCTRLERFAVAFGEPGVHEWYFFPRRRRGGKKSKLPVGRIVV